MKSKKVYFILIIIALGLIAGAIFYFYNSMNYKNRSLLETVPVKSTIAILDSKNFENFVFLINDTANLFRDLLNNELPNNEVRALGELLQQIKSSNNTAEVSNFLNRQFLASIHFNEDNSHSVLLSFRFINRSEKRAILSLFKLSVREDIFGNFQIFKLIDPKSNQILYYTENDGLVAFSSNKMLLKESINQQNSPETSLLKDADFIKIQKVSRNINFDNLFINHLKNSSLLSNRTLPYLTLGKTNWAEYDLDYKHDIISMNGIILGDSNFKYLFDFFGNNNGCLTLDKVYPAYISNYTNYSFNNSNFYNRYTTFLKSFYSFEYRSTITNTDSLEKESSISEPITRIMTGEFGLANSISSSDSVFIIKMNSISEAQKALIGLQVKEQWQVDNSLTISIYEGIPTNILTYLFKPFFETIPNKYMLIFDEQIILANRIDDLKLFYRSYLTNNTLLNSRKYREFRNNFSSAENVFIYSNVKHLGLNSENQAKESNTLNLYTLGSQLLVKDGTCFSSMVFQKTIEDLQNDNVIWKSALDSSITYISPLVINPLNHEELYLVQDSKYNLYLVNLIGRIIWKRPIEEAILGDITQLNIDGKVQNGLIFNTKSRLFQLNFDGNTIGNYPVILPSKASTYLSLFDYEKNGDFRLFVPCVDRQIRVYDKKGNLVVGFESKKVEGDIVESVQHFNVSDKDYIVLSDQYSNQILDRKGNQRIAIKTDFKRGTKSLFYYKRESSSDFFITSSSEGDIIKIRIPFGEVSVISGVSGKLNPDFFLVNLNKSEFGYLFISEKMITLLDHKGQKIYSKELSVSDLKRIRVFYDDNKPFLSFLDSVSHKVYLFDITSGEIQSGFPNDGHFDYRIFSQIGDSTKLITGDNENSLIYYKIQL